MTKKPFFERIVHNGLELNIGWQYSTRHTIKDFEFWSKTHGPRWVWKLEEVAQNQYLSRFCVWRGVRILSHETIKRIPNVAVMAKFKLNHSASIH